MVWRLNGLDNRWLGDGAGCWYVVEPHKDGWCGWRSNATHNLYRLFVGAGVTAHDAMSLCEADARKRA